MLKEKFKNINVAQKKVKELRRQLRRQEQDFRCVQEDVVVDNFSGGAHITPTAQKKCAEFNINKVCENTACKNYDWARNYIALRNSLKDARMVRNDLLVKYFWVCRKYREYKEYKKLDDLVKLRSREYLHRVCENLYLYDSEDEDTREGHKQVIKVAEDAYVAVLEQRNAARAKFLGRKK